MPDSPDHIRAGDWVQLVYECPDEFLSRVNPPRLGWGRHFAKVLQVFGPGWGTPTDLPCILLVDPTSPGGDQRSECTVAIGDVGRILNPLERLARGFE